MCYIKTDIPPTSKKRFDNFMKHNTTSSAGILTLLLLFSFGCGESKTQAIAQEKSPTNIESSQNDKKDDNNSTKTPISQPTDDEKVQEEQSAENNSTTMPIWIIGDSTAFNDYLNSGGGWGDVILDDFKNPKRAKNYARGGASSKSYKTIPQKWETWRYWDNSRGLDIIGLKEVIANTDTTEGGYLLIQFGSNDQYSQYSPYNDLKKTVPGLGNEFDDALMVYIDFAKAHNVTPILLTPLANLTQSKRQNITYVLPKTPSPWENLTGTRGDWPQTIREIAKREEVILLDTSLKTYQHFLNDFEDDAAIYDRYGLVAAQRYHDKTHYNIVGNKMVCKFIKELACDTKSGDVGFCRQFK